MRSKNRTLPTYDVGLRLSRSGKRTGIREPMKQDSDGKRCRGSAYRRELANDDTLQASNTASAQARANSITDKQVQR